MTMMDTLMVYSACLGSERLLVIKHRSHGERSAGRIKFARFLSILLGIDLHV